MFIPLPPQLSVDSLSWEFIPQTVDDSNLTGAAKVIPDIHNAQANFLTTRRPYNE